MKYAFLCLLLSAISLTSCLEDDKDKGELPLINVDSIYVDGARWYMNSSEYIYQNSLVDVYVTLLTANGKSLKTFNVETSELEDIKLPPRKNAEYAKASIVEKIDEDVRLNQGDTTIWFRDNVIDTKVTVRTDVFVETDTDMQFTLLLNLNTTNAGALEKINFKVGREPEENSRPKDKQK